MRIAAPDARTPRERTPSVGRDARIITAGEGRGDKLERAHRALWLFRVGPIVAAAARDIAQPAVMPPSMIISAPVTKALSSLAR